MQRKRLARWLAPVCTAVGGLLWFGLTASAADVPAAPASVPVATATITEEPAGMEEEGWILEGSDRKYQLADGSFAVDVHYIDGVLYLFEDDGTQMIGWQMVENSWHYYDPQTFQAAVGPSTVEGDVYLFDYTGAQKTGWRTVDGVRRYYDPETGKVQTGWITYAGNRYYVDADAGKQVGELLVDGVRYQLDDETGIQQVGFCTFSDGETSYFGVDGNPVSGWMTDEITGKQYYLDSTYRMLTGLQTLDTGTYYFAENGAMQTGLHTLESGTYYFAEDGLMQTGLQKWRGHTYLFDIDGLMQTGWQTLENRTYYFAADGVMQTGLQTLNGSTYFFGADGVQQFGWVTYNEKEYYFNSEGKMVTGKQTIDGTNYLFLEDGTLRRIKICLDAGHYGKYNRSPVNGVYYESDMSWKLHLKLKAELEKLGMQVITTRPTQAEDLGLEKRGRMAAGCDLFLSLHSNASDDTSIDGPLACCTVTGTADVLGKTLANTVHEVMGTRQGGSIWKRQGMNGDYYGVLRGATSVGVPAILLEHSYHTNLRATNWLLVDANLQKLAVAEAKVIAEYFGLI